MKCTIFAIILLILIRRTNTHYSPAKQLIELTVCMLFCMIITDMKKLIFSIAVLLIHTYQAWAAGYHVTGRVYRWPDLSPLKEASISCEICNSHAVTDKDGNFVITVPQNSRTFLRIDIPGYRPVLIPVHPTKPDNRVFAVMIPEEVIQNLINLSGISEEPGKGHVILLNVDKDGGMKNAAQINMDVGLLYRNEIAWQHSSEYAYGIGFSEDTGLYFIQNRAQTYGIIALNIPEGTFALSSSTPPVIADVRDHSITEVVSCWYGDCTAKVEEIFTVKDLISNEPVSDVNIDCFFLGSTQTAQNGFIYVTVPDGTDTICSAFRQGYRNICTMVRFEGINNTLYIPSDELNGVLEAQLNSLSGVAIGLVRDKDGNPVKGAVVKAFRNGTSIPVYYLRRTFTYPVLIGALTTSSDGLFLIKDLNPYDRLTIRAEKTGYFSSEVTLTVPPDCYFYTEIFLSETSDYRYSVKINKVPAAEYIDVAGLLIESNPEGITCGSQCTGYFVYKSTVTLYENSPDFVVAEWQGCDEVNNNKCILNVTEDVRVTALIKKIENTDTSTDTASGNIRCFIASAVFGEDSWQVNTLRTFRDRVLLKTAIGRKTIALYYRYSPSIAMYIKEHRYLKEITFYTLSAFVYIIFEPEMSIGIALILTVFIFIFLNMMKKEEA